MASVTPAPRQASSWRTTATSSFAPGTRAAFLRLGPPSAMTPTLEGSGFVGVDDLADELAANNVGAGEGDVVDLLDALEDIDCFEQAGIFSRRKVDLRRIAGHDHLALIAEPR